MIVDFMKQNEEVFNAYIFGESFKAHRQQMEILVSGALKQKSLLLQHC